MRVTRAALDRRDNQHSLAPWNVSRHSRQKS